MGPLDTPRALSDASVIGSTDDSGLIAWLNGQGPTATARNFPVVSTRHTAQWAHCVAGLGRGYSLGWDRRFGVLQRRASYHQPRQRAVGRTPWDAPAPRQSWIRHAIVGLAARRQTLSPRRMRKPRSTSLPSIGASRALNNRRAASTPIW